ncbi:Myosuppressin [Blattella germanica]|uniref:Leucomyosuppressin n=1 Tax=Blattella germanica TaxID=6973 RepID=Q705J7_BLAGE|nr:Myosuppressin [Blattella germanica]CAF04070.1 leucomyosuppressin precursor [Blattella germanica]
MKYVSVVLISVLAVLLACMPHMASAVPPPQCSPNILDDVPPRVRKVCAALSTIYELSNAMEAYLDDKVVRENTPLVDTGVKRQDVDHVFLRFGRRR